MAASRDNVRYEFQHTPAPFGSVITGKKIEPEPWLATKPSACTSDSHFEKLTNEMKRLSVTRSRRCYLPAVDPSHKPHNFLCAPSPLENSPLTGKKINIHRKNNHEAMWWPSEAEPGTTTCNFLGYCLPPGAKSPSTSFGFKSMCQSEKEPSRDLLASQYIRECLTLQDNKSTKDPTVCVMMPSVTDAHQNKETFYPEPGLAGVVVPGANNKGKRVFCTVSGHEPIRVRVYGEAPVLSTFHLFQTELLFDKTSSEVLIAEPLLVEVGDSSQDFIQEDFAVASSMNSSEGTAAFYSNLSTGHSTVTDCHRQLLDDIQEQTPDVKDNRSTRSKMSDDAKINIEQSCTSVRSEEKDGSIRVGTLLPDKDEDEDRVTGTFAMPEVWILDREGESEETEFSFDAPCSTTVLRTLTDVCSEDFAETLYDENERWEKPPIILRKLKRPPQTQFTFSKIDVHHIQSANRSDVMHRLTKLPIRCQKRVQTSPNTILQDCYKNFPPSFMRSFTQPEKSTPISTINLELDVNVEQNKPQLSLLAPSSRMLKLYNPNVNKGISVPREHHDIQNTTPTCSRAQFVFVGKGVFNGSEYNTPSNSTPKPHYTVGAYNDTNGITNAEADSEGRQLKVYVNLREASMETSSAFSGEAKQPAVFADLGRPKGSPATHYSHPTNQEDVTDNVSLTMNQHARGHTEHYDCQVPAAKCHDSLGSWGALVHRSDSASEIQQSVEFIRRQKGDSVHHFSFRSASTTAFSVTSLDDVPYNSPVESPCRINSPVGDLDYINGIVDGQNRAPLCQTDTMCRITTGEEDSDGTDSCPEKLDVLPTEIGLQMYRYEPKSGQSMRENVCLETTWTGGVNMMNENPQLTPQGILKQAHEDDTAVSDSTFDLSPRSHDRIFFDLDDGTESGKFYSTSELPKKGNQVAGNTATKPKCVTEAGQHVRQPTCDESPTLQQVSQSAKDPSQDLKVNELSMLSDGSFLHEYTSTDTHGMILTEQVPKKKCNLSVPQEPVGPVYKNVRFADVDKVISFTVPDMAFPVRVNSFNGISALRTPRPYEGPETSKPVLHKQTLQLRTQNATHGQRQTLQRPEFVHDAVKFNQRAQETVKSHCLRDMKWSAHSYRSRYPRPSCMIIRGRSLERQADGVQREDSTVGSQSNTSVMYTICQKCEGELHVKFGSRCHVENDNIVLQKVLGNTCQEKEGTGEVRVTGVDGIHPAERHGCRHRHGGYCNLCNKIMCWGSTEKHGQV